MSTFIEDMDNLRLVAALRELSKAFIEGRQDCYGMHIPAEPYRDGDIVCGIAARLIEQLLRALDAKQAKIDALMMEFCPGEMSAEQRMEWEKHQRPAEPQK